MAPRKRIVNDATSKGKAVATVGDKASLLSSNQSLTEDTISVSPQEPSANIQPSE